MRGHADQWWSAARTLGFELRDDGSGNTLATLFDSMSAQLRPHTTLSEHNWMVGKWEDTDVLVTYCFRDGGSGFDTQYTHAIARIDPSLLLGLELSPRTFFGSAPAIGVPGFDQSFALRSFVPEAGRVFVWPTPGAPLAELAVDAARKFTVHVYDSCVAITASKFEADPEVLREMLGRAARIAAACKARRVACGLTLAERALHEQWAHFAERERMTFDEPRRALAGSYRGLVASVVTRSTPHAMWNEARVALPTDSGITLTVTPESGLSRFGNFIGFADIEVGDPEFDRALRLKGEPAPQVRAFFAQPELRRRARELVARYAQFAIRGRQVTLLRSRVAETEVELTGVLEDVASFVRTAAGIEAPAQGPYRGAPAR